MPIFGTTVNNLFSKSRKPKDIAAEAEGNDVKSTKDLKNGYQRRRLSSATTGIDNNQNSCSDDCGSTVSGHSLYNREAPLGCEQNGKIQESGLAQIAASQAKIAKTKSKVEKPKSKDPEGKDAKAKSKDAKEKSKHAKANAKDAKAKSPKAELKRSDTTCSILGDGELHKADSRFKVDKESSDSESKHFTGMPHLAHKRGREMTLRRKFTDGETGSSFTGSSCNRSSTSRDTSMEIIRMHGNDIDVVVNTAQPASRATSSIDSDQHDLSTKWSLWEMVQDGSTGVSTDAAYENACRHVKSFATIEQFMHLYNGMPDPSCVLKKQSIVRKPSEADFEKEEIEKCLSQEDKLKQAYKMFIDSEPEQISAMMIFRDGISPTWEDPANFGGGHFQFVFKSDFPVFAVDELWERTLFSILGNLVEGAEHITGIRLADKLSSGYVKSDRNNLAATAIRFEVWHSDQPTETINALRKSLHEMFTQPLKHGGSVPTLDITVAMSSKVSLRRGKEVTRKAPREFCEIRLTPNPNPKSFQKQSSFEKIESFKKMNSMLSIQSSQVSELNFINDNQYDIVELDEDTRTIPKGESSENMAESKTDSNVEIHTKKQKQYYHRIVDSKKYAVSAKQFEFGTTIEMALTEQKTMEHKMEKKILMEKSLTTFSQATTAGSLGSNSSVRSQSTSKKSIQRQSTWTPKDPYPIEARWSRGLPQPSQEALEPVSEIDAVKPKPFSKESTSPSKNNTDNIQAIVDSRDDAMQQQLTVRRVASWSVIGDPNLKPASFESLGHKLECMHARTPRRTSTPLSIVPMVSARQFEEFAVAYHSAASTTSCRSSARNSMEISDDVPRMVVRSKSLSSLSRPPGPRLTKRQQKAAFRRSVTWTPTNKNLKILQSRARKKAEQKKTLRSVAATIIEENSSVAFPMPEASSAPIQRHHSLCLSRADRRQSNISTSSVTSVKSNYKISGSSPNRTPRSPVSNASWIRPTPIHRKPRRPSVKLSDISQQFAALGM